MQSVNYCRGFILVSLLFLLGGCSSQPARHTGASVPDRPSDDPRQNVVAVDGSRRNIVAAEDPRQSVVATARDMLGTPYRRGGTTPTGFDCSGLVWYSHRQAGIEVPRTTSRQMSTARPVKRQGLKLGDLLFFRIDGHKGRHVGIYIGKGRFIHAPSSGKRVATARLVNPFWRDRLIRSGNFY
jgi:cell wall-associated NlpC family hydrolase